MTTESSPDTLNQHPYATTSATQVESTITVLLVEDQTFVRDVICEVLQVDGYRVVKARNARDARRKFGIHHDQIELLITDIVMPGGDGQDLAEALRKANPHLATLFISGYPQHASSRAVRERLEFYLPKPFSAAALSQKVRHILAQR